MAPLRHWLFDVLASDAVQPVRQQTPLLSFIAPDVNARKASGIVAYVTVGSSAYLTSREGDESDHDVVLISIDHRQEPESALNG